MEFELCKDCGNKMKEFVGQMFGEGRTEYVCLFCGNFKAHGNISEDQLNQMREEEIEEAESEDRKPLYKEVIKNDEIQN